jgi:hypothetical protein
MANGFEGGWIAYLSNGDTVFESPPVEGERTPWQGLLQHIRDNPTFIWKDPKKELPDDEKPLFITGLRLQYGNVTIMAMPHKQCDGYYQARELHRQKLIAPNPVVSSRQGIGSVVGDQVIITWVEIKDGQMITRSDVRPLASERIHTTLS